MMASVALHLAEHMTAVQLSQRQYWLAALVSLAAHALLLIALAAPRFEEAQLAGGGASFGLGRTDGSAPANGAVTDEGQWPAEQSRSDSADMQEEQAISPAAATRERAEPSLSEPRQEAAPATVSTALPQRAAIPPAAKAASADATSARAASQRAASPPQGRTALPGSDAAEAGGGSNLANARERSSSPISEAGAAEARGKDGAGSGSGSAQGGAGDAATTNYTGLVTEHIRRNRRSNSAGAGEVILKITIGARGEVQQVNIYRSSGGPNFDRQALRMARMAAPYPKPPPGQGPVLVRIKGS